MTSLLVEDLTGIEEPRLWTRPLRPLTPATSRGFEAIAFAEGVLGLTLHPWQKWLLIHLLELLEDGTYRFRTILVLVARQNGKTTLVKVLALWRMYLDGAQLVIGTAQNLDVAEEAWSGAVEIAESTPDLAVEIGSVLKGNGKKLLTLVDGQRYKIAAATRSGGRGLSGDLVVLDELREHTNWHAWGAVTKTTMARASAQVICLSNAGDAASVVLNTLRARALAGLEGKQDVEPAAESLGSIPSSSLGIFEWSAPEDCPVDDMDGIRQANPSLGHRHGITMAAVRDALETDPEDVFRTEVLCQSVPDLGDPVVAAPVWEALTIGNQKPSTPVLSVEVHRDRSWSKIGAAWRVEGKSHVQIVEEGPGTDWVVPRLAELVPKYGVPEIVIDAQSEALTIKDGVDELGYELRQITGSTRAVACGLWYDAVVSSQLTHNGDPDLARAISAARWREAGDGARVIARKKSIGDVSALYCAVLAHYGLTLLPDYDVLSSVF